MIQYFLNKQKPLLVTAFILSLCTIKIAHAETSVLVFHSYHSEYPWTKSQMRGFTETLNHQADLFPKYSIEELDTKRIELSEEYEAAYEEYIRVKYADFNPKLIYATDDDAFHFLTHRVHAIFPNVPMVFSGINEEEAAKDHLNENVTILLEEKSLTPNLELINQLFPKVSEVLILGDSSVTAHATHRALKKQVANSDLPFNLQFKSINYFEDVLATIESFTGKTLILSSIGAFKSKTGELLPVSQVITQIQEAKDLNIFSLEDSYIQNGVLGGYVNQGYMHGRQAAQAALKAKLIEHQTVIEGELTNQWVFDSQALKRKNISLPDEISDKAFFVNQKQSFIQRHEGTIKIVLLLLTVVIIAIVLTFIAYLTKSRKIILANKNDLANISKRLNLAQDITLTGNWEWDIVSGRLWWSEQVFRLFGLKPGEISPTPEIFFDFVVSDDLDKLQKALNLALETKSEYKVVHRITRKDGVVRVVEEAGRIELDENQKPIRMNGAVRDITEQYENELTLKMQGKIIDAVQDSIMVHDFSGHFIYLNEVAWESRGYSQEEMLGLSVSDIDTQEYRGDFDKRCADAIETIRTEGLARFRVEHLRKDGSHFPVEVFATLLELEGEEYVLSSVRDISEQTQIRQELEASEKKYRNFIENAMVGVYETRLSGEILYGNEKLITMMGYKSFDEVVGSNVLTSYEDISQRSKIIDALKEHQSISNFQVNILDKNGEVVPVLFSAALQGDVIFGTVIDLREIYESREKLEIFKKIIEQVDDSVMVTDSKGYINYVNPAFTVHTGFSTKDVLGNTPAIMKSGLHDDSFYKLLWKTIKTGKAFNSVLTNKKKDGEVYYENKTITPLQNTKGQLIGFVSTGKDVTKETLANKQIAQLAATDKLTGLANRHKFEELYQSEESRAQRDYQALSLILVDIDHFKVVNDDYGHDVGDSVLIETADLLKNNTRNFDVVSRWGGEEFLILCPGTDINNAAKLAEKLRQKIEKHKFSGLDSLTVSMGVSSYQTSFSFKEFFKQADDRLYQAKTNGRNQVCSRDLIK